MAAEAAERRLLDSIWCGNHDDDPVAAGPAAAAAGPAPKRVRTEPAPSPPAAVPPSPPRVRDDGQPWACPACTYVNQPLWLQCDVCQTARSG